MRVFFLLLCVFGFSVGQVLFKLIAKDIDKYKDIFSLKISIFLIIIFFIYAILTIAWIWLLQKTSLSKAYPIMALAFVIVPLISYFYFDEKVSFTYAIGILFIIIGVFISYTSIPK